jgi:hypothetical protein
MQGYGSTGVWRVMRDSGRQGVASLYAKPVRVRYRGRVRLHARGLGGSALAPPKACRRCSMRNCPLPDSSVDRMLLVPLLEHSRTPGEKLRGGNGWVLQPNRSRRRDSAQESRGSSVRFEQKPGATKTLFFPPFKRHRLFKFRCMFEPTCRPCAPRNKTGQAVSATTAAVDAS